MYNRATNSQVATRCVGCGGFEIEALGCSVGGMGSGEVLGSEVLSGVLWRAESALLTIAPPAPQHCPNVHTLADWLHRFVGSG